MTTAKMLEPAIIFKEMISAVDARRETMRERSRRSSRRWRDRQPPEQLKQKQRRWELDYRTRLKATDPEKYTAYCGGNVNA